MRLFKIIFSPTGGTEKAAEAIVSRFNGEIETVDLTDADADFSAVQISGEDISLIAVPSYSGRVPALAAERIKKLHGNGSRCVLLCVYGNRAYEDTLAEMQDIAGECGFSVTAAAAAIAEHSIIRKYAEGRPDKDDIEELHSFGDKIFDKLQKGENDLGMQIPGSRPYRKAGSVSMVPKADGNCTGCGLCAEKCPAKAIDKENIKTVDSKKCIGCMRCVSVCPQGARKVNEVMLSAVDLKLKKACSVRKDNELYI